MEKPSKNHKRIRKIWLLVILLPVILLVALHFFIAYKARNMIPRLVRDMSNGNYTMTAEKLRFNYLNPSITLTGISFRPVKEGLEQTYSVQVDTLVLRIEKILPLILNRQVNVEDILVVSPSVEIMRNKGEQEAIQTGDLNGQIKALQANTMEFLNELKVKNCRIKNASFRYFPFPGSTRKYNIQHINLDIADFSLAKPSEDSSMTSIEGSIKLSIQNPQLEIPDSVKRIQLDYFEWSNKEHDVNVGKFVYTQRSLPPMSDSFLIQLDTIAIRKIDWKVWLDSGIVKLDTILARNGSMYFESSGKEQLKKNKDSVDFKKLKVWDAIGDLELDYFAASHINVWINNRNPGMERNNTLIGDSLAIHHLSIRPERSNPIMVQNLEISVRSFIDRGVNNAFQSSFSRLSLRGDTMLLNNYVFQSTKNSKLGVGNSLAIPTLSITGISLQDLMDKKANVREIRMDNPELNILSGNNKGNKKLALNEQTFREIRPYVDVDRVVLNDAKITVKDRSDKSKKLGTEKFSAIILSKKALAASDAEGIMASFTLVDMDHLFFITPKIQLEMFGGAVNYSAKTVHFDRVEGSFNNQQIKTVLNDVTLHGSPELRPFNKGEVWDFSLVSAGSGTVDINGEEKPSEKSNDQGKFFAKIDSMDLKNINVRFKKGSTHGEAFVKTFNARGQEGFTSKYRWTKFDGTVEKLNISNEKFTIKADDAELSSAGRTTLRNASVVGDDGHTKFSIDAPEMSINTEFHSFEPGDIVVDMLSMKKPLIKLELSKDSATATSSDKNAHKFSVKEFALEDPEIDISIENKKEKILVTTNGKLLKGSGLNVSKLSGARLVELAKFQSSLNKLIVKSDSTKIFNAESISFSISSAKKVGKDPAVMEMENFNIGAVTLNRYNNEDTIELHTGGISLGLISDFVLQKDSLLATAFKIPPAQILPSSFFYRTPEKNIGIHQFSVDTRAGYLTWDSLELTNRISRDSFFARQPYEKDYITFSTGKLRADDLRPVLFGKDTTVYMRKLTLDPFYLTVERDKRRPDDTVTYRPLLVQMLKKIIPFPLKIDSVHMERSVVRHNVLAEKTGNEGTIFFTNIHGNIFNLRTFDYQENDSLRIALETKFFGKGDLTFVFRQDYTDTLQGFLMGARMGALDMKELNNFITPLFNIKINKGKMKTLRLRVNGNDHLAYGSMDMYYDDLKLSVLNEENKKKKLYSFLVNLLVRTRNSKTGIVYAERLKEKSVFNLWARISLNGLLTSLGVKKNGAQVRKFYKSLKKHQLPEDIF